LGFGKRHRWAHPKHAAQPSGSMPAMMAGGSGSGGGFSAHSGAGVDLNSHMQGAGMARNSGSGMDALHDAVLASFNTHGQGDEGAHVSSVFNDLRAKGHDDAAVRQAIEFLASEGHLYSTLDEEHYKSTTG